MPESAYLDYNATAPIHPEVIDVMAGAMASPANPSSVHQSGRKAKKIVEDARGVLAEAISCWPQELVFTGSGSEANALALKGFPGRRLAVSTIEHVSVRGNAGDATLLDVNENGVLRLDGLQAFLKASGEPALVSVMLANNETGVIQPIREIADLVHEHGGLLHCDAIQAFGKITVDVGMLGADLLTISAHKIGGPQGVGALFVRNGLDITPLIGGGGQELRRRAGTENVAGIAGFACAAEIHRTLKWQAEIRALLDAMEAVMLAANPEAVVLGQAAERLPNTSAVILPGLSSETQLMHFDLSGFEVSAGSACSSGRIEASHVAKAMGFNDSEAGCMLRISAGWQTTPAEIKGFTQSWIALSEKTARKTA